MKHFIIKKSVLFGCFALVFYYIIMELYYVHFITVEYQAYGFFLTIDLQKYIVTKFIFIFFLFFSFFISKRSEFIYAIFIFFFIFFLVPILITYSLSDRPPGPPYATVFLLLAIGTVSVLKFKLPPIQTYTFSYGLIMVLIIVAVLPIIYTFGIYFNFKNIFLAEVYSTRDQFGSNSSVGIDYLYNWLVKALIPIFLVFFLIHKRKGYAFISLILLLYLYMISGNKIVYITLFVMLFFFFIGNDYLEKTKYFLLALVIGLLLIPIPDYFFGNHSFKGIFVMRMLFFPSQLNYYYFDFFNKNPLYFAESNFFNTFFTYPYDRPIGFIISETYFNFPEMNANNGIISDGYMNLGYPGVVLNIVLVSCIFLFFNSSNVDPKYLGIFFLMVFLFLSAPMLSMIITSGLWIIILMTFTFMKRKKLIENGV